MAEEFEDEYLTEEEKLEKAQKYETEYIDELNLGIKGLAGKDEDLFNELRQSHDYDGYNVRHSNDGRADARTNVLEMERDILYTEKHADPHLKALMQSIDKRKGAGAGRRMFKKALRERDSAYFDPSINPNIPV